MTTPTTLRNRLGNPVTGEDFWPRTDVVDSLVQDLREDRGSRRLFALRRIGKTSVLKEVEHRLQASGMTVVHVDVQGLNRFRDFLAKVFEKLPIDDRMQQARQRIAANPVTKTLLAGAWARLTGQPASQTEAGFQNEFDHSAAWAGDIEAVLSAAGPVVLIIDELPFMLRNMMRDGYRALDAERFLATLRSWRMNAGVRMLLSGSIGLHQLHRNDGVHVADHIGDVIPVSLAPLPRSEAVAMVEALARGAGAAEWSPDLSEAVVEASAETWPIFLQYGFNAAHRRSARDAAAVRVAIESLVRQQLDETLYGQFRTRLSRYDGDEPAARRVLKAVVAGDEPVSFAAVDEVLAKLDAVEKRDDLLEALREDDFILFDTEAQTLRPASRLVPVWVRARAWGR